MQLVHLIAGINPYTYRHALLYLDEIACGIVDRDQ